MEATTRRTATFGSNSSEGKILRSCTHTSVFYQVLKIFQISKMSPSVGQSVLGDPMLSSLSPLGNSLLSPSVPLPNIAENSVQSFTNETQRLLAQRYYKLRFRNFFNLI